MEQTSTVHEYNIGSESSPSKANHDGLFSSYSHAISEVIDPEQCLGGFCDSRPLVAFYQPRDDTHLASARKRVDAADSRHEGPKFDKEAMRALQGEK
ncbi:unnamed protein product [Fusarium graminearum]|nr:unnamed protein product [Fusarium graminearum]CAG1959167.1 unnamed protein product [Fusarium graminearum]CAG1994889.1 unnamed protein product [Fusarium graminearum]VTO91598.1 unnamed protein product [Fusarium graminearum]